MVLRRDIHKFVGREKDSIHTCVVCGYGLSYKSIKSGKDYIGYIHNHHLQNMSITRFKEAQERFGEYETALEEIRQGRKRSHWIWYIFPQLKGLGRSYNSEYYGIASLEEAKEYLGDAVLRGRLLEISKALMEHKEEDIHSIMGGIDAQKLRSSMTLFESAAGDDDGCKVFGEILDTFFDGKRDGRTLGMLKAQEK